VAWVRAGAEVPASPRLAFPVQIIYGEVNFPYRKKNPWTAGDKSDVDSLDVSAGSVGGSGPLD
jgi:hypothetical protein